MSNVRIDRRRLNVMIAFRDMTAKELARNAGIHPQTIYNIRTGQPAQHETAYCIAKALNVSVEFLKGERPCRLLLR